MRDNTRQANISKQPTSQNDRDHGRDRITPRPAPSRKSFREVWLITAGHALTHWYPATFYLLLPLIGHELGLSYCQIGSILTTQAAAGAVSNVLGGLVVDSIGRKGLLMGLCLFWVGAPYLLMGFTHEYWTAADLRGAGRDRQQPLASDRHPAAGAALPRAQRARRCRSTAWAAMSATRSRRSSPARCSRYLSWREVMIVNVIPGIVMSCVLLFSLGRMRGREPGTAGDGSRSGALADVLRDFGKLLGNRTLIFLSASSIFRSMTQSSLMTFLPIFLATRDGLFAGLDRRLHGRPADAPASPPRRSPAISPTGWAAARSS